MLPHDCWDRGDVNLSPKKKDGARLIQASLYPRQDALSIALRVLFVMKTGLSSKNAPNLSTHSMRHFAYLTQSFQHTRQSPVRIVGSHWIVVRLRKPCRKRPLSQLQCKRGTLDGKVQRERGPRTIQTRRRVYASAANNTFPFFRLSHGRLSCDQRFRGLVTFPEWTSILKRRSEENAITEPTCSSVGGLRWHFRSHWGISG